MSSRKMMSQLLAYEAMITSLGQKDRKGLASLSLSNIRQARSVVLNPVQYSILDMKAPDYLAKISLQNETFLLHMEFEANYSSNRKMQRRMLKYYSVLQQNQSLPIKQMLVLLRKPPVSSVSTGIQATILDEDPIHFSYDVLHLYEMDKYDILTPKIKALYPLRIFMKHEAESPQEHLRECLEKSRTLRDTDYYFLTVEYSKRLYQRNTLEKLVDEKIYAGAGLFEELYGRK